MSHILLLATERSEARVPTYTYYIYHLGRCRERAHKKSWRGCQRRWGRKQKKKKEITDGSIHEEQIRRTMPVWCFIFSHFEAFSFRCFMRVSRFATDQRPLDFLYCKELLLYNPSARNTNKGTQDRRERDRLAAMKTKHARNQRINENCSAWLIKLK